MNKTLIVVVGPTGTGKSAFAVALAQACSGIIISADSRQVYRGLDIGTAKPTLAEQQGIPHYLLDVADPTTTYTVAQYQLAARQQIATAQQQGQLPILVGGTGLYIEAVVGGLDIPPVAPNGSMRAGLAEVTTLELHRRLAQLDLSAAQRIHPNDRVRLLRALEIIEALGALPQRTQSAPAYQTHWLGLDCWDLTFHTAWLRRRTEHMLAQGWVEELQGLQQQFGADLPLLQTLGYRELGDYLAGNISLEGAIEQIVLHTRQYAKRQRTWFKRYPEISWSDLRAVNLDAFVNQVLALVADDSRKDYD
jgi:tRNA dimethylallyltransferase